jgi:hypothetical protein
MRGEKSEPEPRMSTLSARRSISLATAIGLLGANGFLWLVSSSSGRWSCAPTDGWLLALARRSKLWPSTNTEIGRFLRAATIAGLCLLPVGLLSFAKIGGDMNTLHTWYYLIPAIVLAGANRVSAFSRSVLPVSMLVLVFMVGL